MYELQFDSAIAHKVKNAMDWCLLLWQNILWITIVQQLPQSPDINPLDLGIFKTLADTVELTDH